MIRPPITINCKRSVECELPPVAGPCRGMFPSFYFNPSTKQCGEFIYGGCQGNANRFETKESCLTKCGEKNETIHEDE
ncbi:unnamed protein product [Rotaria sordida]|uniref:BPTI/Kunitz inhibitor domain-containing protein n=1 Tax=Rotaria sordida TaxID=392033 RepID=A0A814QW32_9BILA|nr:unnamed protein product [Rotaria sordida]CAF1135454.1 unnamed protein product [Rotaria sordida]CAF1180642.1 unnamed protein product [Rotaria sordida]CAF3709019.1 unnamed protein product [Rotaria sordida]CAF3873046.1 unnamed protein product [Rotaria sordida]